MKRLFSHPIVVLSAGLSLRLFLVFKYPGTSGDTVLYDEMATNWLRHGVYAMEVNGAVTPVDLRMPGYPAFLALIYALTGHTGADAQLAIMLAQVAIDLLTCVVIGLIAAVLITESAPLLERNRVFTIALWLSALCPFTANYTAVALSEVFAVFFTALALLFFVLRLTNSTAGVFPWSKNLFVCASWPRYFAPLAGFFVGCGTLFRPETPLVLMAAWLVGGVAFLRNREWKVFAYFVLWSGQACVIPLTPWAIRNAVTLHEVQFLAPKNSNLPSELIPYGFMAWEKTWLYRVRDCYLVSWKLNDEVIHLKDIPARAFDTPKEKQRVARILASYNTDLSWNAEEDNAFAQLARERTARHPARTYVWLPAARVFTIWFTPRIELLPFSGKVFPLGAAWEDDPIDLSVTAGFFVLNILYVALALWGAMRLWGRYQETRTGVAFLVVFVMLRTIFLTTLETPEPRYVLVCFPVVLGLVAHAFARRHDAQQDVANSIKNPEG